MAGYDNTKTFQRAGNIFKITALFLISAFLVFLPIQAVHGYYIIRTSKENINSECYYITGNTVFLCEGMSMALSEVKNVDDSYLTEDEKERRKTENSRFFEDVDELLKTGQTLDAELSKLNVMIGNIIKKRSKKGRGLKKDIKNALNHIKKVDSEAVKQKELWLNLKIPSRSFVVLREVKQLDIFSVESVCRDYREYVDDWSPTVKEYAKEHLRQKALFEESFIRYLKELKVGQQ